MRRGAYRRVYFGAVAPPGDADRLILHHDSLAAMVRGSYWR